MISRQVLKDVDTVVTIGRVKNIKMDMTCYDLIYDTKIENRRDV